MSFVLRAAPALHRATSRCMVRHSTTTTPTVLVGEERSALLGSIPAWTEVTDRDAIQRSFVFQNFNEAWGFMSRVALVAEQVRFCLALVPASCGDIPSCPG